MNENSVGKKIVKRIARFFLAVLLLVAILFLTSRFLEKKVVQLMVEQINQSVEVPVFIDNIEFSLLRKFPLATLQFHNVTIKSAKEFHQTNFSGYQADTLLYIKELYLAFNLMRLMHHEMELTKAYIDNGFINVLVDKSGKANYSVLKEMSLEKGDSSNSFNFQLKFIEIKQFDVRFHNQFKDVSASLTIPAYKLKGEFYKESYSVATSGTLKVEQIKQGEIWFRPDVPANLNLQFDILNEVLTIKQSSLKSSGIQLNSSGTVTFGENVKLDLQFAGDKVDVKKLSRWVANKSLSRMELSGYLSFKGVVSGIVNEKVSPKMAINFSVSNGTFKHQNFDEKFHHIAMKGSYSNGNQRNIISSSLNFEQLDLSLGKSSINSEFKVHNFKNPSFDFEAGIHFFGEDLAKVVPKDFGAIGSGTMVGNFHAQGTIQGFPIHLDQFRQWEYSGTLKIQDADFQTTDKTFGFSQMNGDLMLLNQNLSVQNLNGTMQQTSCRGSLQVNNYFGLFSNRQEVVGLNTHLQLGNVTYPDITFLFTESDTTKSDYELEVEARLFAESYTQDAFKAQRLRGKVTYAKSKVQVDSLNFQSLGGTAAAQIKYDFSKPNYSLLSIDGRVHSMDINHLLTTFNNFGQGFITEKNLQGQLSSDFETEMKFVNGTLVAESIEYLGYVRIDNGILQKFEPVKALAVFTEIPELERIEFSSMENNFLISDGIIQVPKMDIKSNAFDVTLYGQQYFTGNYEYHLQLFLSDFLVGKAKRLQKQQTEFGWVEEEESERTKLYLMVQNKEDQFSVTVDKQAIKSQLKAGTKNEKKEFKKALHDEFGWFKKDSTLTKPEKKEKKKQEFSIEWDEE
ncbi:MAG: hypothetical protein A2W95_00075 [Bacteroidetes bacterium GWA2_40_14]|nr:MAG: hypothetical protein A2W95_00075 [Bacteroidetes bacterium GWA2_40_14]